jgi:hypothetical protein
VLRAIANRYGYRLRNRRALLGLALRGETPFSRTRELAFALTGGVVPLFQGGGPEITMTTTAAVTAGRIVEVSGDRSVRHGQSATTKAVGVAKQTADAVGDKVAVATTGVWMLRAQGAINAGDHLAISAGNDGRVMPIAANTFPTDIGIALAAIADGADGPVLVRLG